MGARAGDDEVGGPARCKAVKELPVIVLQCAQAGGQACFQSWMGAHGCKTRAPQDCAEEDSSGCKDFTTG